MKGLEAGGRLSKDQHAYKKAYSTETALENVVSFIEEELTNHGLFLIDW